LICSWTFFSNPAMKLSKDLREFIELLNSHGVEYVIVGAYGLAFHGVPRFTGDIDFFVRRSPENAARLERVIHAFGFGATGLKHEDFLEENQIVQLGIAPNRIDLLTGIDGVSFDEAWQTRNQAELEQLPVNFLARELLIKNKLAVGREQDIADATRLRQLDP
jgi:hypothetical protein